MLLFFEMNEILEHHECHRCEIVCESMNICECIDVWNMYLRKRTMSSFCVLCIENYENDIKLSNCIFALRCIFFV